MPPSAPQKSYITQFHDKLVVPLPQPTFNQSTGLTCLECPSQLKYVQPYIRSRTQDQLPHLIAWRCPSKTHNYFFNLTRSLLLEDIQHCNLYSERSQPAMNLNNLLNPTGGTQPKQTLALATSRPGLPNSDFDPKHREEILKNGKCTYQLCLSCCNQLQKVNLNTHCGLPGHCSVSTQTSTSKPQPLAIQNFLPQDLSQSLQSSQANCKIAALVSKLVLEQIHCNQIDQKIMSIRKTEAATQAACTVILEFWTSELKSLISQFEAKNWPLCTLSKSPTIQPQGESTGLNTWKTKLWIWMANLKSWVTTPLDFAVKYPKQPQRIDEAVKKPLENWPGSSTHQDALSWYNAIGPTSDYKAAWDSQFEKVWLAGKTSIYWHYRFIKLVNPIKLTEILQRHPHFSLLQARKLYPKEWQASQSDNKRTNNDRIIQSSQAAKRLKPEAPQKESGLTDSNSDIEFVF
ncbi:hypothetical protein DFH28DRAFT_1156820 [Melampsora americana]|nr:hypothetical protein DFH28DRAFT_1156820 [Melampsora americana]